MKIIYRPQKEDIKKSMIEAREFESFEALQDYIIEDMRGWIQLKPEEIISDGIPTKDNRIGWEDSSHLCIVGYNEITDKNGHRKYFGGEYNYPLCIGMFATKYKK